METQRHEPICLNQNSTPAIFTVSILTDEQNHPLCFPHLLVSLVSIYLFKICKCLLCTK